VLDVSGSIERDDWGGIAVRLPAKLTLNGGDAFSGQVELDARRHVVGAAEVCCAASRVLLRALGEIESSRRPRSLLDVVPDRRVSLGGGIC